MQLFCAHLRQNKIIWSAGEDSPSYYSVQCERCFKESKPKLYKE
jgi:hypothetical protein